MSQLQVCVRNNLNFRHAMLVTLPPGAVKQVVLRLCFNSGGLPKPLSMRIGIQ